MKIIQIAVTAGGDNNSVDTMYALADDGSLWRLFNATEVSEPDGGRGWRRIPAIPVTESAVATEVSS